MRAATALRIPVNIHSGVCDAGAYLPNWLPIDKHPDNQVAYANLKIHALEELQSTALTLQNALPFVRCIGWNMTVDENENVKVMEWNGSHNGIKFCEATQGACFTGLGWENLWWWRQANTGPGF